MQKNSIQNARQAVTEQAAALQLEPLGIAPVDPPLRREYFYQWLHENQHGDMAWLARDPHRRTSPSTVLPEARAILAFGLNYYQPEPPRRGRIAKYALGKDYHKVFLKKLKRICDTLRQYGAVNRPYVDTGPLLERPIAEQAGLGWQGKNTILLHERHGQWLFLGFILTSLPFPANQNPPTDRCGSCTRCIDACPTGAITAPYQLDARKCIGYLTVEHKGPIPLQYRTLIGDHLFGCDDCLDVCPWNKWARQTREAAFAPRPYPELRDCLAMDDQQFHLTFAGSPIRRLKRPRWLRNVAVVLGNIGTREDLPALQQATADPDPLIAEHAQWAVSRIQHRHPAQSS